MEVPAFVREHPYRTAAFVFIGGLALVYIYGGHSGSSGGQVYDPNLDPNVINAEIAAASQQAQIQAQAQSQADQIQGQYNLAVLSSASNFALAQLQMHTTEQASADQLAAVLAQTEASRQVSLAGISAQEAVQEAGIAAQVTTTQITQNAAITENQTNNQTTQIVSQQTNATQQFLAQKQADVSIAQTNALVSIAKINAQTGILGGVLGFLGNIAGAIL